MVELLDIAIYNATVEMRHEAKGILIHPKYHSQLMDELLHIGGSTLYYKGLKIFVTNEVENFLIISYA